MALCACDGSALVYAASLESCFDGRGAAAAPPFCDASALAAAAAPFREGSLMLLRGGSGPTLLPFGLGLVCLLRCSKPVFDAGGIGATLPVLGPVVTALPVLGLVLAISSDTQARRAVRPDSCIFQRRMHRWGSRRSDQPHQREVAQHSALENGAFGERRLRLGDSNVICPSSIYLVF
eukprot:scaffold16478_cov58-Phaeocystis_antarctica.AAC.3